MDILKQLLGRLHPLIVHLPIGFIMLGLLLQVYDRKQNEFNKAISLIYLWAGYFAILACITGYLQYLGEGYAFDSIKIHLWSGIATALFSFLMWARIKGISILSFLSRIPILAASVFIFILISFTGHQGGNITHGEDYLIEPLPNSVKTTLGFEAFEKKEIVLQDDEWKEAVLYTDIINPILNNNCVSCHNPKKTKGELLLNTPEGILQGGKNGTVLATGFPLKSELFARMKLPKDDDKHMPPNGKSQPTKEDIRLIGAWIENGHSFDKTIGELGLEKSLFQSYFPKIIQTDYPDSPIKAASKDSIILVKSTALHVDRISENTNYLKVSALNKPNFTDADFKILAPILPQIAILDLGGTQLTDSIFDNLSNSINLTILKLDNTRITGKQIQRLQSLPYLKAINLSNTNFKQEYVDKLSYFPALEKVFLFNSVLEKYGSETLSNGKIKVEYGNYKLPIIARDSLLF